MFLTKPRSSEAIEGDAVIIMCEVIGDPKPEVLWLRDFLKVSMIDSSFSVSLMTNAHLELSARLSRVSCATAIAIFDDDFFYLPNLSLPPSTSVSTMSEMKCLQRIFK
jgi:hypothetical protein